MVWALLSGATGAVAQTPLHLAAEDDWYPYSALRGGKLQGLSVDIVRAAYAAAQTPLKLEAMPFNRGLHLTRAGVCAGVFNAGPNEKIRKDFLIPVNEVATSEQVVIGRTGEAFKDTSSFHQRRLSLTLGYTYPVEIVEDPRNRIEMAVSDLNNFRKIALSRSDYTIVDRLVATTLIRSHVDLQGKLAVLGQLAVEKIYVLFARSVVGQSALTRFDMGMELIRANGELNAIRERWGVPAG